MWSIVYVWCVEKGLMACWIILDVISCLCGCELCNVMKMIISSLFVWTCHLIYSEALVLTSVMCIEKEWVLKRIYHFEGRITRRDGYYISRDVSSAVMVTIIKGHVVHRNRCMDRYVPHGSRTERQRVCITRSDMHHYTWNCIQLHCTSLSLVNLILRFVDLVSVFLWKMWLMNSEFVVEEYIIVKLLLLNCVLCKLWIVKLGWSYVGCSCGSSVGM